MVAWLAPKVKFLLEDVLGLIHAEGRNEPRSLEEVTDGIILSAVSFASGWSFSAVSAFMLVLSLDTFSSSFLVFPSKLISLVGVFIFTFSFLGFVTRLGEESDDGDLARLLGSLDLPRGGDDEEKTGGGRQSTFSGTFIQGPGLPFSFIMRAKSEPLYLTFELCFIAPFLCS